MTPTPPPVEPSPSPEATEPVTLWRHNSDDDFRARHWMLNEQSAAMAGITPWKALPAADFDALLARASLAAAQQPVDAVTEAKARLYDFTLEALKSDHNRALPFGQVMADLALDQPPSAEPVYVRFGPMPRLTTPGSPA